MKRLSLSCLGPVQVTLGPDPLQKFRTNRVQALLIYLAVEHKEQHRREALMELLWPGLPLKSAQVNLRQTLYQLRKLIPEVMGRDGETPALSAAEVSVSLLLTDRHTIQIHPDAAIDLDLITFDTLAQQASKSNNVKLFEQAAALYRGDFLADFYLPDSETFEEWANARREAYRRQVLDLLQSLAALQMEEKQFELAETAVRRQLAIDPLRDIAHRQLIELLARSGRRSDALAHYDTYCRLLADELGVEPSTATLMLHQQITSGHFDTTPDNQLRGYLLGSEIGSGAFGVVYRAKQPAVGREVAIKIIAPQYASHPDFIRRFETEAQLVARLEHPHIVPLYDYWREPDGAYLVMRYLRGGSVEDLLQDEACGMETAVSIFDQITAALTTAHKQGVIHRDIKPANILLDEEGNAYLTDFGIAKDLESDAELTMDGTVIGSPKYISPEQLRQETVSPQTDIYCLGLVLYELLTGQPPFVDESVVDLISRHLNDPIPLVQAKQSAIPTTVDAVLQQATAKNPADRFPDMQSFKNALRAALTAPIPTAEPTSPKIKSTTLSKPDTLRGYDNWKKIGFGAFADVYRARHTLTDREVAIKVIQPPYANNPEFIRRFDIEARILARLEHPHIVPIYDCWRDPDAAYLVTRYLQGGSLDDLLRGGKLEVKKAKSIIDQIASALNIAHEQGIVHRDIKPANIVLDEKGNAYLTDFGIAKDLELDPELAMDDKMMGSPKYMSPDQLQREPVSPQTDIYSLGIVLYEMLTGQPPFMDESDVMLVSRHLNDPLPLVHEQQPEIPAAIDKVLQQATAKDPAMRFPDMPAFKNALHEALTIPISAAESTSPKIIPSAPVHKKPAKAAPVSPERHKQLILLEKVKQAWVQGVLEDAMAAAPVIHLTRENHNEAVDTPWQGIIPDGGNGRSIPQDQSYCDLFMAADRALLILGSPGAGKTFALISLARDLITLAETDTGQPIPVILNLSTWAESKQPLTDWVVEELTAKYQIPRKIGRAWVEKDELLLLLDGLDEMPSLAQADCVNAINQFREAQGLSGIVVCCRTDDYNAIGEKLRLGGAIGLRPLTSEQIDMYLAAGGVQWEGLKTAVSQDPALQEMAQSPLMLNTMCLAFSNDTQINVEQTSLMTANWSSEDFTSRRRHLFATYVQRMFQRRGAGAAYTAEQTKQWLSWLATKMFQHNQSIFLLERMQPNLFTSRAYLWAYALSTRIMTALIFAIMLIPLDDNIEKPELFIFFSIILFGMTMGVVQSYRFDRHHCASPTYAFKHTGLQKNVVSWGYAWFIFLTIFIFYYQILAVLIFNRPASNILAVTWELVFVAAIAFAPLFATYWVLFGRKHSLDNDIETTEVLTWSWRSSLRGLIIGAILSTVLFTPMIYDDISILVWSDIFFIVSLFFLVGGILGAGIGGFQKGVKATKTEPNQGIKLTLRYSLVPGTVLVILSLFLDGFDFINTLRAGMMGVLLFGGLAILYHFILRIFLWHESKLPWRLVPFLDDSVSYIFLRKIGGGYIFVHRLVQAYFAELGASEVFIDDQIGVDKRETAVPLPTTPKQETTPKPAAAAAIPHNLPQSPTPFVGREEELNALDAFIVNPDVRLVTIVGPGGMGKTRLALVVAEQQLTAVPHYPNGIFFINLAPVNDGEHIILTLAQALEFPFQGQDDRSPKQQLLDYLQNKKMLLLFDNFEHLLNGSVLLAEILQTAPGVQILVTSRERLHLRTEQVFPIDGLTFPVRDTQKDAETYTAVQLFLQTAQQVQPDFTLQDEGLLHLVHICRLVSGMPLAMELAAAWVDMLSLADIAAELQQGLDLLETDIRDMPERHRSVYAAIDHSWQKLEEQERAVLARLSVFRGGFTREAAQTIARANLRQLARLVNKSLLRFDKGNGRYQLHELIRQFLQEKLEAMGTTKPTQNAHCDYYCNFLQQQETKIKGHEMVQAFHEIENDLENVRAAWNWAVNHVDIANIDKTLVSLRHYYDIRSLYHEGEHIFRKAAKHLSETDLNGNEVVLAKLWIRHGHFCRLLFQLDQGRNLFEQSLPILRQSYLQAEIAYTLEQMGVLFLVGTYDSDHVRQLFEESLEIRQKSNDRWGVSHSLFRLGQLAQRQRILDKARIYYEESLAIFREIGNPLGLAVSLRGLGTVKANLGEYHEAKNLCLESITWLKSLNAREILLETYVWVGSIVGALGVYDEAKQYFQKGLTIGRELNFRLPTISVLTQFARTASRLGKHEEARQLIQEAMVISKEHGEMMHITNTLAFLGDIAWRQGNHIEARQIFQEVLATAREIKWDQFIAIGLNNLARPAIALGQLQEAKEYFIEALRVAHEKDLSLGIVADSIIGIAYLTGKSSEKERAVQWLAMAINLPPSQEEKEIAEKYLAELRSELPAEIFAAAVAEGKKRDLMETAVTILNELEQASLPDIPHNLPQTPTPFVGREEELNELDAFIVNPEVRLVTIVGPGGMGKTRLSIAAGQQMLANEAQFPDGVFFVPLAALQQPDEIVSQIALTFNLPSDSIAGQNPTQQLLAFLHDKQMLLILDNFEHLLDGATLLSEMLAAAPNLQLLATSRERLQLYEEQVFLLEGLAFPGNTAVSKGEAQPTTLSEYTAVQLFLDRAQRTAPDYALTDIDAPHLARLCQLVAGTPLALELAAGWMDSVPLPDIVSEIQQSLDFLETDLRNIPERHRSMRAVFDSTWQRLNNKEQAVLAQLSVFRGGFTLEAAAEVAQANRRILVRLVRQALVVFEEENGRYQLHELLRQYAAAYLQRDTAVWEAARDEHGRYYLTFLHAQGEEMKGPQQRDALDAVEMEIENVQTAWLWAGRQGWWDSIDASLIALQQFFATRSSLTILRRMLADGVSQLEATAATISERLTLAKMLTLNAWAYAWENARTEEASQLLQQAKQLIVAVDGAEQMGVWFSIFAAFYAYFIDDRLQATEWVQQSIKWLRRRQPDSWELALALYTTGMVSRFGSTNLPDRAQLQESCDICKRIGDHTLYARNVFALAFAAISTRDYEEAIHLLQDSKQISTTVGEQHLVAQSLFMLGEAYACAGDFERSIAFHLQGADCFLQIGYINRAMGCYNCAALCALQSGHIDQARELRQKRLATAIKLNQVHDTAWSYWAIGDIERVAGDLEKARHWYEKAHSLFVTHQTPEAMIFYHRGLADIASAQGQTDAAYQHYQKSLSLAQQALYTWGPANSLRSLGHHTWSQVYALIGLGRSATAAGDFTTARDHFREALQKEAKLGDRTVGVKAIAGIAEWLAAIGQIEQAVELAALVNQLKASWFETKQEIQLLPAKLSSSLAPATVEALQKKGQARSLDATVAELPNLLNQQTKLD